MAVITCSNLSCGYDGKEVVSNLNFTVEPGDYLLIVGENGAGKSTLIKTILSLIKPVKGTIQYGDGLVASNIGYLSQQTQIQKDFPTSVYEVVLSGFLNKLGKRFFYSKEQKQAALDIIDKLGMSEFKKKSYKELSGGQQQRVLLARALCATDKLLLLDEPVTGLDPEATLEMYQIIDNLNKNKGITIIMISHDVSDSIEYCNKVLKIGKTVFYGSKNEYLASLEKVGGNNE